MDTFTPPTAQQPRHVRYDAIHRALLTGLLSNLGNKTETHEYLGTRGIRFSIFPGSALFGQKQKWLMAGELVETTKLYARTCAGIQPQWIEQAAEHLVDRTYSEPRWDSKTTQAIATEKVALHGLVLVPARVVPFSPINPRLARELFIHHALVLGDLHPPLASAPFVRHNARLVEEVQLLEAKIRQRNLLADAATRYAFYDARIPLDVTNGTQFETWRRHAERATPRILYMEKADLLRADAPPITPENYPDRLSGSSGGLHLPLVYRYEPGEPGDGLTLTVPVAALPQLRPEQYEWLVPGMIEDKIAAMLRELPGQLRRNFVPVPSWAQSAVQALQKDFPFLTSASPPFGVPPLGGSANSPSPDAPTRPAQTHPTHPPVENRKSKPETLPSLREALAAYLAHQTGIEITAHDFDPVALPSFLRMAFKVVDDQGNILATSRDLPHLQRQLAPQAAGALATLYQREFHRDIHPHAGTGGGTGWDFGDLPDTVTVQRFGMSIVAYPALVDLGDHVALRLLPAGENALQAHRAGVRRFFQFEHKKELKFLAAHLPDFPKMALQHFTLGESKILREDLLTLTVDRALFSLPPQNPSLTSPQNSALSTQNSVVPRTQSHWLALRTLTASRLTDTGRATAALASEILNHYHYLTLAMDRADRATPALADVREQLLNLIPPHFLLATPFEWLEHYPRYLAAARARLEELENGGPAIADRDLAARDQFLPWWTQYLRRKNHHDEIALVDPELILFRWLLEEYRVHLFAQELGTPFSTSPRRLQKQWDKTRP
jgi:ATP-dependent helicase HrpA